MLQSRRKFPMTRSLQPKLYCLSLTIRRKFQFIQSSRESQDSDAAQGPQGLRVSRELSSLPESKENRGWHPSRSQCPGSRIFFFPSWRASHDEPRESFASVLTFVTRADASALLVRHEHGVHQDPDGRASWSILGSTSITLRKWGKVAFTRLEF